jgi:hypothetical protein
VSGRYQLCPQLGREVGSRDHSGSGLHRFRDCDQLTNLGGGCRPPPLNGVGKLFRPAAVREHRRHHCLVR